MKKILVSICMFFAVTAYAGSKSVDIDSAETGDVVSGAVEVTILKYKYIPEVLEIKAGQTVRWINKEKRQYHNVWFESLGEEEPEYMFPDDMLDRVFSEPGEYDYRCGPHPEMTGKIIVH